MNSEQTFHIVFLGGGLSNCIALKLMHDLFACGHPRVRLTLISAWETTYYSAMLPGIICGGIEEERSQINLRALAIACDARLIVSTALQIDPRQRKCWLQGGREITYDALSINIGSRTRGAESIPGMEAWGIIPRSVNEFMQKVKALDSRCKDWQCPRLIIVGSGMSGLELACSLKIRLGAHLSRPVRATIVDSRSHVALTAANAVLIKSMRKRGIEIVHGCRVKQVSSSDEIVLENGQSLTGDALVFATGPKAHPLITGLESCPQGFILVTQNLQTISHEEVFAAGDCVTIRGMPRGYPPKTGVHAIREGPILALNLLSFVRSRLQGFPVSLLQYSPSPDSVEIIDLGDGAGLARVHGMTFAAKWPCRLKQDHDKAFIERFAPSVLLKPEELKSFLSGQNDIPHNCGKSVPDDSELRLLLAEDSQELSKEVVGLSAKNAVELLLESSGETTDFHLAAQILQRFDRDLLFREDCVHCYESAVSAHS